MFKLLRCFRESFKFVPLTKRTLTNQSKNSKFEQILQIQSIDEFNEKLKITDLPVIVNFSAAWCHNCKILSPMIEAIVRENSKKIIIFKVNIEEHIELALDYRVYAVPTLFGVYNGQIQSRLLGLHEVEKIRDWVEDFLKKT